MYICGIEREINDKKFFKYLSNLILDLAEISFDKRVRKSIVVLNNLHSKRVLGNYEAGVLYMVFEHRRVNIEEARSIQEPEVFDTIGKEYAYMEKVINDKFIFRKEEGE